MTRNVGGIDRGLRIVIGLFGLSLIFWGPKSLLGLIGLLPLFTGLLGWCPPYILFGFSTCKQKQQGVPAGQDATKTG
jgi:hypothetical protein